MAKLSARGRYEIWRVEKQKGPAPDGLYQSERVQIAYMSDRRFLKRMVTTFGPDHVHDYGWKQWRRLKEDGNADVVLNSLLKAGYRRVEGRTR